MADISKREIRYKIFSSIVVLMLLLSTASFYLGGGDDAGPSPIINTSTYSQSMDTIYVKGGDNTLQSIDSDVNNESVFDYDSGNSTAYCYSNITIEGWLNISNEDLLISDKKTIQINSTGGLNITNSFVKGISEDKRWWQLENRYSVKKQDQGHLKVENSKMIDTGWDDSGGKRGVEIQGPGFELRNSTFKGGRNGLVFLDCVSVSSDTVRNITIKGMNKNSILCTGSSEVKVKNSTLEDSGGNDVKKEGIGNITLFNSTFEDKEITGKGYLERVYLQDFLLKDEDGVLAEKDIQIFEKTGDWTRNFTTDLDGELRSVPLLWRGLNETRSYRKSYGISYEGNETYFTPSNYNQMHINFSEEGELYMKDLSLDPNSYVPVNNSLDPQNITITAKGMNDLSVEYKGNLTFYWGDKEFYVTNITVPPDSDFDLSFQWTPDVEGYGKIRAELEPQQSKSTDNLITWSETFFAGYYNESIETYDNFTKKSLQMVEYGVKYEDAEGYYSIYEDWLPDILMECGLTYYAAYEVTGNESYYTRGRKQFDYALSFRDRWGLYNRSTSYEVRGRFENNYEEWSTHRNVRAALALQQAYLYTGNKTYRDISDNMIKFVMDNAARENITYHDGTNYTVFWESTEPNNGEGGIKGTSKNFTFLFVNGYIQLGRLLTQAYYDENINSSFYHNESLLQPINTCIEYLVKDQIDSGDSKGTWAYFSYYDEPDPWKRRSMTYAALTAKELARTNTYLHWDNISRAISNYTDYVEERLTLRSAVDVHNGGSAMIITYNHWRSLYTTIDRNVSKIEDFMFSNIFFNENGTTNWFTPTSDRIMLDPKEYGFLYVHYNPLRTLLWDDYYENRSSKKFTLELKNHDESDGWNFISSKLVPNSEDLKNILNDPTYGIDGEYDKVMWYNRKEDRWQTYIVDRNQRYNNLDSWDHKMGIWIHMIGDANLTIEGTYPYRTRVTLKPGWNMVGYPSKTNRIASNSLPSEVSKIGVFNKYAPYNIEYVYDLSTEVLVTGRGYWVYNSVDHSVDWTIDYI